MQAYRELGFSVQMIDRDTKREELTADLAFEQAGTPATGPDKLMIWASPRAHGDAMNKLNDIGLNQIRNLRRLDNHVAELNGVRIEISARVNRG